MSRKRLIAAVVLSTVVIAGTGCGAGTESDEILPGKARSERSRDSILDSFDTVQNLISTNEELWGGTFADGDVLVIKYAHQEREVARAALIHAGVQGRVRLVETETTFGELRRGVSGLRTVADGRSDVVGWGPDYERSLILIDVTGEGTGLEKAIANAGITAPFVVRTGQPRADSDRS